jgi:hypothetical protein
MTVTTYALVTFHIERAYTAQQVMGPRLKSPTRNNFVRRAATANSPAEVARGRPKATHTAALVACGHGA